MNSKFKKLCIVLFFLIAALDVLGIIVDEKILRLIFVIIILMIYKSLGDLLLPVLVYGIAISTFGALSFYNYLEKRTHAAVLMLLGAFFFIISDGMLAIEKFQLQTRELAIGVMLAYIVAQYLICRHMIKRSETT